jgi:bifunctional glutamyl/prolyl-tRNA synthetase
LENAKAKDTKPAGSVQIKVVSSACGEIDAKIAKQGDLIRDLKASKASKDEITKEVNTLLSWKIEYKNMTGQDWKPSAAPATPVPAPAASLPNAALDAKIAQQGELVRDLKAKKASKDEVTKEVNALLALKAEYKSLTGQDWKPSATPATTPVPTPVTTSAPAAASSPRAALDAKIALQGELVRDLKAKKASKEEVTKEVQVLLSKFFVFFLIYLLRPI